MEQDKNTEKLILESAEDLFLKQGFAKTTMGQIAERVGCNQALVHYYYRTKEKLFDRIFEEKARITVNNFINIESEGATFEEKLAMKIRMHFDFLKENPRLPLFLYIELSTNPEKIRPVIEKIKKMLPSFDMREAEKILQAEIEKGNIREISFTDLVFTVVALNIAPFVTRPIFESFLGIGSDCISAFIEKRKEENVRIVLARLRPLEA